MSGLSALIARRQKTRASPCPHACARVLATTTRSNCCPAIAVRFVGTVPLTNRTSDLTNSGVQSIFTDDARGSSTVMLAEGQHRRIHSARCPGPPPTSSTVAPLVRGGSAVSREATAAILCKSCQRRPRWRLRADIRTGEIRRPNDSNFQHSEIRSEMAAEAAQSRRRDLARISGQGPRKTIRFPR